MDTTSTATHAWQRMRRQSLLPARSAWAEEIDDAKGDLPQDSGETLPMLYRGEAFAEDLLDAPV